MLSSSDKRGRLPVNPRRLIEFNKLINDCKLVYLSFERTKVHLDPHRNDIKVIKDSSNNWISDPIDIANHITKHFSLLFTSGTQHSPRLFPFSHCLQPLQIAGHLSILTNPINDDEILKAFKSFKPFKSPRPDGLHPLFFHSC
ncbi:hypothetical protein LIER_05736 [Lithospermum erythrorhizon]|uniref:Maturase K n=1 Tax=Lithospermum erythrorhizon TaxID=34254 RepID=A0AAV3P489_LITER